MLVGPATRWLAAVLLAPACLAVPALAQQTASPASTASASVNSLGVSLKNIRRQLQAPSTIGSGELRYHIQVEVVGKNPPVEFFKDFNLSSSGGVGYGSPTHQEILNAVTPWAFRNWGGGVDVLSLKKR